jgi:flagellin-like hook-associated protein FlgL
MANDLIASTSDMRKGVSSVTAASSVQALNQLSPAILRTLGIQPDPGAYFNARNTMHQAATFEDRKQTLSAGIDEMRHTDQTLDSISNLLEEADQLLISSRKAKTQEQIVELSGKFNSLLDTIDKLVDENQINGRNLLNNTGSPLDLELGAKGMNTVRVSLQPANTEALGLQRADPDKWFIKTTKSIDRKAIDTLHKSLTAAIKSTVEQQYTLRDFVSTAATYQDFTGSLVSLVSAPGKEKPIIKMEEKEIYHLLDQTREMLQKNDTNLVSRSASLVLRKL